MDIDFKKLAPWNWFKKEQEEQQSTASLPVQRNDLPVAGGPVSPILQLHREIDRLFDDGRPLTHEERVERLVHAALYDAEGRLRFEEELARGGMGAVRQAFDATLQRRMAVKTMHAKTYDHVMLVHGFLREAQAARTDAFLRHRRAHRLGDRAGGCRDRGEDEYGHRGGGEPGKRDEQGADLHLRSPRTNQPTA